MNISNFSSLNKIKGPILLTGHTGFKGTWLTLLLELLGKTVVGVSLPPTQNSFYSQLSRLGKIEEYFMDLRSESEIKRIVSKIDPEVVFHLAAQPLISDAYRDPLSTLTTNVQGTWNLIDSLTNLNGLQACLVITTDKVYENFNLGEKFNESHKLAGSEPYSASKVAQESIIDAYIKIMKSKNGAILSTARSGNVIGGGDKAQNRISTDILNSYQLDSELKIRDPKATRPWLHVLDTLNGYLMQMDLILSGFEVRALNFGPTDTGLSVDEFVSHFIRSMQPSKQIPYVISAENAYQEAHLLELDSTLAHDLTGWKPLWSQHQAIEMTASWWSRVLNQGSTPIESTAVDLEKFKQHSNL